MTIIKLDATRWHSIWEFYNDLLEKIGAPAWHGKNINALLDSMVYSRNVNKIKPPIAIEIMNMDGCPSEVRDEIETLINAVEECIQDELKEEPQRRAELQIRFTRI